MRVPSAARLARFAVAAGLTLLVLWKSNPAEVLQVGRRADLRWLAAAAALVVFDRALMAFRWVVLLRALEAGTRPSLRPVVRIFFVSTFVGTFLPSVGGDVARAWALSRLRVDAAQAAASVLMDRLLGVLSLLLLGLLSLSLAGRHFASDSVVLSLMAASVVCAAAGAVIFSERAARPVLALVRFVPGRRAQGLSARLVDAVRRYARHHTDLVEVLVFSVLVQVLRVVQAICLGAAIQVVASSLDYFVFIPLILLVMLVPISVNGLGTSQVAFVWFFGQVGVPAPDAFALSVLFVALGIVGNLPGGLLYGVGWGGAEQPAAQAAGDRHAPPEA